MSASVVARPRLRLLRRGAKRVRARSRLRAVNLRRTASALARPIPDPPAWLAGPRGAAPETSYGAPRTLLYVTVKRDNPGWRDIYGHWWVEIGDESYGWWPRSVPLGVRQVLTGTTGVLNGMGLLGRSGSWHRDAQHGRAAAHAFHPVLIAPVSDEEVRQRVREFAHSYSGDWRWSWTSPSRHGTCRTFQDALLRAAGLEEGLAHLASRGSGCPFLYRPRTSWWWLQDRLASVGSLAQR